MRKPSGIYGASRMQNMVQIRAWSACFATKLHIYFLQQFFWRSQRGKPPRWGHSTSPSTQIQVQVQVQAQVPVQVQVQVHV